MGQVKPWQIAVVVVGVLVLGISLFMSVFRDDGVEFSQTIMLVDVTTGKLYEVGRPDGMAISLPATDPRKNPPAKTLYAAKNVDGKWYVNERMLGELGASKIAVQGLDPKTGLLADQGQKPESLELFK
jgi:hypothetical protein